MAKKPAKKATPSKKGIPFKNSSKATKLLLVALIFGILGVVTVQLSSASPLSDFFQRLRSKNSRGSLNIPKSGTCNANIKTGNSNVVGNNMNTSVTQTGGSSGVTVKNTTTSYSNTGGKTAVGC